MPISIQCACGHKSLAPDDGAGKKAKCPNCGVVITIPLANSDDGASTTSPERAIKPKFGMMRLNSQSSSDEPWFYGWLDRTANIAWIASQFLSLAIIVVVSIFLLITGFTYISWIMAALGWLVMIGGVFVASALILLAVDVARNIRENRSE